MEYLGYGIKMATMRKTSTMYQGSLDSFLGKKDLNVMHLSKSKKVEWLTRVPKGTTVIEQSGLKRRKCRLTTFTSNMELVDITTENCPKLSRGLHLLLISNLQKAIRRNKPEIAMATACELSKYKGGIRYLLRRLPIIIIEDKFACYVKIAEQYNILVWIMATEKGWDGWFKWVLGLINYICGQNYGCISNQPMAIKWCNNPFACSLLLRSFYGGNKGDRRLLSQSAALINTYDPEIIKTERITFENMQPTDNLEILPEAVDYHCHRAILNNIGEKFPAHNQKEIKQAIWNYSSVVRYNCFQQPENEVWRDIKHAVRSYQNWYISVVT